MRLLLRPNILLYTKKKKKKKKKEKKKKAAPGEKKRSFSDFPRTARKAFFLLPERFFPMESISQCERPDSDRRHMSSSSAEIFPWPIVYVVEKHRFW